MALLPPVANARLTQHFGNLTNTLEPHVFHRGVTDCMFSAYTGSVYAQHFHMGTDLAAPLNTPIVASEAGTVVFEGLAASPGPFAGGGIICEVAVAGGMHYVSAHMANTVVNKGQFVSRGQLLGHVGSTGTSTGPHDHFAVFTLTGTGLRFFRNPEQFLPGGLLAGSSLILPQRVAAVSTGSYIRSAPALTGTIVGRTTLNAVYTFQKWVSGGWYIVGSTHSNVWAMVWFDNAWRYIAKPLVRSVL